MRRSKLLMGAVVSALLLAIVPMSTAQAAKPSPSTSTIFVAISDGVAPTAREVGQIWYITQPYWFGGPEYFLVQGSWVRSGTFRTNINHSIWSDSGNLGLSSGTFVVRDSLLGDCDGLWAWNWGKGKDGLGVGRCVGSSKSIHVKITFPAVDPVGLPNPPPADNFYYVVISTY
jgi:hypothetical protein